jgi:hypothetical protein
VVLVLLGGGLHIAISLSLAQIQYLLTEGYFNGRGTYENDCGSCSCNKQQQQRKRRH